MFFIFKTRRRQFSGSTMMTSPFGGGSNNNSGSGQIFVPESPLPSPKFSRHSNQRTSSPIHAPANCGDPNDPGHPGRSGNSSVHYPPSSPAHPRSSNCSQGETDQDKVSVWWTSVCSETSDLRSDPGTEKVVFAKVAD